LFSFLSCFFFFFFSELISIYFIANKKGEGTEDLNYT